MVLSRRHHRALPRPARFPPFSPLLRGQHEASWAPPWRLTGRARRTGPQVEVVRQDGVSSDQLSVTQGAL